ncbi:MAG TPA: hypothetical protein VMU48_12960 [Terracidiphilus sp.]|nr:hypothetical protein [Terracidiphilus sp.]
MNNIFKSYFYWTYPRGNVHYDVMVTLILLFIFVTPQLWDYGDKPSRASALQHPITVIGNDGHGVIVSVRASDVVIPPQASQSQVKDALRKAIEPITGDAVFVEHWETTKDDQGHLVWRIWAHR